MWRPWSGKRRADFEEQREGQGAWGVESKARMAQNIPEGDTGLRTCRTLGAVLPTLHFSPKNEGKPECVNQQGDVRFGFKRS